VVRQEIGPMTMIGEKLGSFRLDAILATGATSVVFRATSEAGGRPAAVKALAPHQATQGVAFERFRREAEILQQFRHPHIVRFLALGRYKGVAYFAMEYIAGETVAQLIARRGPLPWPEVIALGIPLCEALHYVHEHGVIHRNVEPTNVMIDSQGQIKLIDFSIARDLDATTLTLPGRILGGFAVLVPELIRGTPEVGPRTDLYALGAVLYEMLTGQPPFTGATAVVLMHCHLNQPPPRPGLKVPGLPRALDDLVVTLMAKSPDDRPAGADAVAAALRRLQEDTR
jgi:serine/threonine-protein kinase